MSDHELPMPVNRRLLTPGVLLLLGLTFIMFGEEPPDGEKDFRGLIYEGAPPPPLDELAFPKPGAE